VSSRGTAPLPLHTEEAFRRLVESAQDYAIFMLTPDGLVATWNAGAQRIKGYEAAEIIGQHFSKFYPREAVAVGWPASELQKATELGRFEDEGWRIRKGGGRFWANVVITTIYDERGAVLGFSKITRDLTERREHEEQLRRSEENFRLLIEGVGDYAIYRLDPNGIVASWNLGAQRLKGYAANEIIGQHFSRFYREEDIRRRWPEQELEMATKVGRFEDEGWRVRKDGTLFWANVVITAIHDEKGVLRGFSKITRDLTERRRHEQRLKESEENLRFLIEGVKDHAIFMLDPEGIVLSWNAGAERVHGFGGDEVIGRSADIFYTGEDIAAGKSLAELETALRTGFSVDTGWRVRPDDSRFWADVTITTLRSRDGVLRGFAQITRDLTERRRVEELESEGKRINEFIAMLAHELRNPLAPIANAVGVLAKVGATPEVQWCTQVIDRQVVHLSRLVDDLLDVSRISSGKIQMRKERLELGAVVTGAVEAFRPTVVRVGHTLEMTLPQEPLHVDGDAIRLTQVIVNLLNNSAKYTPNGGRLQVRLERRGPAASLQVIDNGIGMSKELIETAFNLFVQGDRALDRSEGGLGIGLTLVKRIIKLHGGDITASSAGQGQGTEMTVTLPLR
jgi:PAS domain S-box-containing protein